MSNILLFTVFIILTSSSSSDLKNNHDAHVILNTIFAKTAYKLALSHELQTQNYKKAREHYLLALEYDPSLTNAHYNLAMMLMGHFEDYKNYSKHMLLACKNFDFKPNDPSSLINLGSGSILKAKPTFQDRQSANDHYENVLKKNSFDVFARLMFLMTLKPMDNLTQERVSIYMEHAQIIISQEPHHSFAQAMIAGFYGIKGDLNLLMAHMELAVKCQEYPLAGSHMGLAIFLERDQRYEEAEKNFKLEIPNLMNHIDWGNLLERQNDLIGAYDQYALALQCKGNPLPMPECFVSHYQTSAMNRMEALEQNPDLKRKRGGIRSLIWQCYDHVKNSVLQSNKFEESLTILPNQNTIFKK